MLDLGLDPGSADCVGLRSLEFSMNSAVSFAGTHFARSPRHTSTCLHQHLNQVRTRTVHVSQDWQANTDQQ